MSQIYIPTSSPDQWAQFLAEPVKHWRQGYSARALAYSWQESRGFPSEVGSVLESAFPSIELLLAFPEHKVPLPGGSRPSQNDIWVLARSEGRLISIAVEGKVSEPFGPTVQEWQPDSSPGKAKRLAYLLSLLDLPSVSETTRYQLLHRTASAIIEAHRFNAADAIMLVHSFSQSVKRVVPRLRGLCFAHGRQPGRGQHNFGWHALWRCASLGMGTWQC
ncbi:hypothetical protein ThidrDRAFT_3849 [Thiorhodococcus drewsii AZ1]|uniref:DUF6946 domain-containing protein n=1 Tax=Thiorhodococcus drewsii AZ1 TaxID=765913 RepID=G2E6F5_9GAMM|nr:hypothetical protein ThidrDRAFT_3849 [Thiorhodococcus drewsii AZ1]